MFGATKIKKLLLSGSQALDPQSLVAISRVSQVAGYGYLLNDAQKIFLDSRLKLFRQNGGLPDWYLAPDIGVNKNLLPFTRTMATGGWSGVNGATIGSPDADGWCLMTDGGVAFSGVVINIGIIPTGNLTLSVDAKSGTASQINFGVQEGQSPFGQAGQSSPTLTAGGSRFSASITNTFATNLQVFIRVGTGAGINEGNISVRNIQLEVGGVVTTYQLRSDGTAVKSLNFGAKNANGDATFLNGTTANMLVTDAAAGQSHNFLAASSQGVQSSFADWYPNYSYIIAYRPNTLGGALLIKSNASDRLVVNANGSFRFNGTTGLVESAIGALTAGSWVIVGVTVSGTTVKLYKNGVLLTPATNTLSARNVESATNWSISTSAFINGITGESALIPNAVTDAQMANIFNVMRSKYAL